MASRRNSLSPPERKGTMDPGARELPGSDSEDHYSDAISGSASPKAPASPIPRTRVERVDDKPAYGEVPGTQAYALREGDAKPDEFAIIPDPDSKLTAEEHDERRPSTPGGRPIPKTVVEETPDTAGAITHPEIEARRSVDTPPDVLVKADGQTIENEKGGDNDTSVQTALKSRASIHSRDSSSDLDQPSSDLPSLGPSLLAKEEGVNEQASNDASDDAVPGNAKTDDEEEEDVVAKTEQAEAGEVEVEKHDEEQSNDHDTTEDPKADEFEDASEELENQDIKKEDSKDQFDEPESSQLAEKKVESDHDDDKKQDSEGKFEEPEPSQEAEKKVGPEEGEKDGASFDSFDHKEEKPVQNDGLDDDGFAEAGDKAPDDDGFGDDDFGEDFAEPAQAGGDDFGDDFDDFEEGAEVNNDADFGDFDDDDFQEAEGFSAPAPAPVPEPQPRQPESSLGFQIPDFTHLSPSEILSLTSPYLNALFPPSPDNDDSDSSPNIPTLNVSQSFNGNVTDPIFQHPRSASLWSQLVAPPPLQPPDWIRSRIRRLFLVSLGVPIDLDEILPASKQKKLVLPSLDRRGSSSTSLRGDADAESDERAGRSRRPSAALRSQAPSVDSRGNPSSSSRTPSKQPVNKPLAAATNSSGSANRSSSSARKGPPPEPVFDLVAAKQLCETTDEALSGMTVKELREHVAKLEAMQGVAGEVLVYWQKRTDEKIGDREAFEGVIENLVKHARKVRK
ncbi:hypothetical protein QBC32DRAFT_339402 [Pseudoneurospora amorphoporcata]|uniref:Uncharacterized protein n=1 Tax=Pseudoneurospora amorphoporcata TaxID=241081 RepID=A0AAN6SHA4_9PEZI|nr:hypothetical protein QBC32DRAFT_339402 [Pseudoneurospora amorphoporcata]